MSKFGECAVRASKVLQARHDFGPNDAWAMAAREIFPSSPSSQKKSCPRKAFEGLCYAGKVKDIGGEKVQYAQPSQNGDYALEGLRILAGNPSLTSHPKTLWREVLKNLELDEEKQPNGQMEVLIALFERNLIAS
ncbi:MAG: DUF6979 family protein [Parvibaculales bacterium]